MTLNPSFLSSFFPQRINFEQNWPQKTRGKILAGLGRDFENSGSSMPDQPEARNQSPQVLVWLSLLQKYANFDSNQF